MVASLVVFWPAQPRLSAAPGDLDPTFAGTGQTVTDMTGHLSVADGMAVQPDGKIVVVGSTVPSDVLADDSRFSDITMVRYNPDGTLDDSFGTGGVVTVDLAGDYDAAHDVAIQDDGRIVVVGSTVGRTPTRDIAVVRYHAAGFVDRAFGDNGSARSGMDLGGDDEAYAVALEPADSAGNQKIVVGGAVGTIGVLQRLTATGDLDSSFDEDGSVLLTGANSIRDLALQPDGKIVGVGSYSGAMVTFRRTPDGSADPGFAPDIDPPGLAYLQVPGWSTSGLAVALRPDGKILVSGAANGVVVARYNADGVLDSSFDQDGWVVTDRTEGAEEGRSIRSLPENELIVAGRSGDDLILVRYDDAGAPVAAFGDQGVVITDVAGAEDRATAMAVLETGSLVVAGTADGGLGSDFAVFRYNGDGSPDGSFGGTGYVTTDLGAPTDQLTAVAVDGAGRTIATGYSHTGSGWDVTLARYDQSGQLDSSFGIGGTVTTDLSRRQDRAFGVAVGADTIVVAGEVDYGFDSEFVVARYRFDGTLDPTFGGGDGQVRTNVASGGRDSARSVAIQSNGMIVVAGHSGSSEFAVVRYQASGDLDPLFGNGGIVRTDVGPGARVGAIAVQPNGNILVAGDALPPPTDPGPLPEFFAAPAATVPAAATTTTSTASASAAAAQPATGRDFVVVRHLGATGTRDAGFGSGGLVRSDLDGGDDVARALALQPDGGIVVAGRGTRDGVGGTAMIRYGSDGAPDAGFGRDSLEEGAWFFEQLGRFDAGAMAVGVLPGDAGIVVTSTASGETWRSGTNIWVTRYFDEQYYPDEISWYAGSEEASALAMQSDGMFVVGGTTRLQSRTSFLLSRWDGDPTLDASFGPGESGRYREAPSESGGVATAVTGDTDEARAVAVQPDDGKIVVAGEAMAGPAGDFTVARYNADGTLDRSFGGDGRVTVDVTGGSDGAYGVVVEPDGQIVVAGVAGRGPGSDFGFIRLNPDGVLDWEFGSDESGIVLVDLASSVDEARALVRQPDGALVAAGWSLRPGDFYSKDFALVRLTENGALDDGFGPSGGRAFMDFIGEDEAYSVAVQPDGRIVAAGVNDNDGDRRPALVRFGADGFQDDSFGDGGQVVTPVGGGQANAVAVQPDGRVVVAGEGHPGEARSAFTARYGEGGVLDETFGLDGSGLIFGAMGDDSRATALGVQSDDGAIVVAGDAAVAGDEVSGPYRELALVRYRTDGVPDPRFGVDGTAFSGGLAGFADEAAGVTVQPDGQLVAVGLRRQLVPPDMQAFTAASTDFTALRFIGGRAAPVGPPADLAIEMAADPEPVQVGQPLRYTISVSNAGPGPASAVLVRDELPAGVTVVTTSGSQGEPCTTEGTALVCPVGEIPAQGSAGLTITVTASQVGASTNVATVRSDQFDPDNGNDTASVTSTVLAELPPPTMRINPGVVPPGRVVKVIGNGFTPGSPVALGHPGLAPIVTVTPDAEGSFTTSLVIFAETTPGARTVEARSVSEPLEVFTTANLLVVTNTLNPPNFGDR